MSTRNNKRGYVKQVLNTPIEEPKLMTEEEVTAQEEFINEPAEEIVVEEPKEETREEVINRLVEEQAQIFDEEEEKFLNSTVEEIESQPVVVEEPCVCDETCVCSEPCTDPSCTCEAEESVKAVEEVKPLRKTLAQMTATELNIYRKTGILPLL